jgi:sugar phosphate isomerase/epimerase
MVFCVSAAPLRRVHGTSPGGVRSLFRELADMGIRGVQVGYRTPDSSVDWAAYAALVAACARAFGFRVCAHAPATDISATDLATREESVATVQQVIQDLGSTMPGAILTVHPESYAPSRHPGDDEARMENCRNSLETLADTAAAFRVRIALENMRYRPDAPNRTGMFVDQLSEIVADSDPSTVGLCFDTGHANISENDDLADVFARNAARIIHIHLDDNLGEQDLHLPPGQGNIDFETLFQAVDRSGYDGMVELEVDVPEGDDPYDFCERNY